MAGEGRSSTAMLWQHQISRTGRCVYPEMQEDDTGLYVSRAAAHRDDPLSKRAHAHLKAGSLSAFLGIHPEKDWEYDRSKGAFLPKEIDCGKRVW